MPTEMLHRDDLPLGGFAGLKEHRLVMSPEVFGQHISLGTWPGLGRFVYLADARFNPLGETTLHDHKEVDVISVMVEGRIEHEGSLEHGQGLVAGDVQVQRAGGEGFSHNEVNPDNTINRMIQLWVLPEIPGERAEYKLYKPGAGEVTRIYGGDSNQSDTLCGKTIIEIGVISASQAIMLEHESLAYVMTGTGHIGGTRVQEGDLFSVDSGVFKAGADTSLILIRVSTADE